MTANKYLRYLQEKIHTTIVATVDDNGLPVTCAVDMMDCDDESLYFLTAKGKSFYDRLKKQGYISLTALKGENTMSSLAISVRGNVRELGNKLVSNLFIKNSYMNEIYPTVESRQALTVFQIYQGTGEWFDLSKKPIERLSFTFGGSKEIQDGYFITDKCIHCKICCSICPQKCIDTNVKPAIIKQENCIRCGNCFEICLVRAIEKRG